MRLKLQLGKLFVSYSVNFYVAWKRKVPVYGSTNRTLDGKYIVYLDYDKMPRSYVEEEIVFLQHEFMIGDCYLFQSSELSFHVVCFDKLTAREWNELLIRSSADVNFKRIPATFSVRSWVLRHSEKGKKDKPVYLRMFHSKFRTARVQSNAHLMLYEKLYLNVKFFRLKHDGLDHPELIHYETRV